MDSRGASALSDPDGAFERFIDKHGLDARNLRRARNLTQDRIADVRKKLEAHEWPANSSVVLFGSWGRSELTDRSDDDWALLVCADGVDQDAIDSALEIARRHLGRGTRKPGAQGVFGREIECEKLRTKIGLQEDDNMNLTRRALLLLESREVAGSGHRQCRDRVLERYLEYGLKSNRPPRFLLNDIVRYWRTIAVDFEGKFQEGGGADPKWAERNAKLRTSRKLLFASGLIPVLQCHLLAKDEMADYLRHQLEVSPIEWSRPSSTTARSTRASASSRRTTGGSASWAMMRRVENWRTFAPTRGTCRRCSLKSGKSAKRSSALSLRCCSTRS
jgi:hypothetical protein